MGLYTVRYHAGPYSGTRSVFADDSEHALAKVRFLIRKEMTLPMYSDSYTIVNCDDDTDDYDDDTDDE